MNLTNRSAPGLGLMTMFNPKHTFLILMISLLPATSINADDNVERDSPSYSFWIGIHNTDVFYEYMYSKAVLKRVNEGRVTEVKEGSSTRLDLWTADSRTRTVEKAKKETHCEPSIRMRCLFTNILLSNRVMMGDT